MYNFPIVTKRKIWYSISFAVIAAGLLFTSIFGLQLGLDFTGGSLLELNYATDRPMNTDIEEVIRAADLPAARLQPSGESDIIIRLPEISEGKHHELVQLFEVQALSINGENIITEKRFESFGPSLGNELKRKAVYAIVVVLIAIVIYLAYAFRKVSHPVAAWKFGAAAVIALTHDVLIVVGLFALLGILFKTEVDSFFITALLTLLGFSVHDTIVTLDRVRENIFLHQDMTFAEVVNLSINGTITRSINTSITTLFTLVAIYLFGGATIRDFALALIVGILIGTYSSLFIAAPLLVTFYKFSQKKA